MDNTKLRNLAREIVRKGKVGKTSAKKIESLLNSTELTRLTEYLKVEQEKGTLSRYTKREQLILARKIKKFETDMGGISTMSKLPDVVFVIDTVADKTAIKEANIVGIKSIAFCREFMYCQYKQATAYFFILLVII